MTAGALEKLTGARALDGTPDAAMPAEEVGGAGRAGGGRCAGEVDRRPGHGRDTGRCDVRGGGVVLFAGSWGHARRGGVGVGVFPMRLGKCGTQRQGTACCIALVWRRCVWLAVYAVDGGVAVGMAERVGLWTPCAALKSHTAERCLSSPRGGLWTPCGARKPPTAGRCVAEGVGPWTPCVVGLLGTPCVAERGGPWAPCEALEPHTVERWGSTPRDGSRTPCRAWEPPTAGPWVVAEWGSCGRDV